MPTPTFPVLKTGVVAQYPTTRSVRYQNQHVRFLDGSEQRFRDIDVPLRRWAIDLTLLDEMERQSLMQFFEDMAGPYAFFSFTDPWDGTAYPNCSLEAGDLAVSSLAELRGSTSLAVVENRT